MSRARVLLADDHAVVAESLASLLASRFDLVGVVHDGVALVAAAMRLRPAVIVTDLAMPGMSGLEVMKRLKQNGLPARVVFLTMHEDAAIAGEALRCGAAGYVLKHSAGEELFAAIHEALSGRVYVTSRIAHEAIAAISADAHSPMELLTSRQKEVLHRVVRGLTMKEVAAELSLSPRTVESHKYRAMQVLGVRTTAELIQYAIRHDASY